LTGSWKSWRRFGARRLSLDREQTIDTLKPFVLEETYEVLEAIDRHDHRALCESSAISCSKRCFWHSSNQRPGVSRLRIL